MKVLFFTHYSSLYGANKSLIELILNMKKHYQVYPIVITGEYGEINQELDILGIENYFYRFYGWVDLENVNKFKKVLKYFRYRIVNYFIGHRIYNKIKNENISIVHSNSSYFDIGAKVARKLKVSHIWHIREFGKEDYNLVYYKKILNMCRFMEEKSDRIVFISNALKDKYYSYFKDKTKVQTIYNGVDKETYYIDINNKKFRDKFQIIFTGAIKREKNQFELIKAIDILVNERNINDICVCFLGDGDLNYIEEMKVFCDKKNIIKNIRFEGRVKDVTKYIQSSHVGIISSYKEAFGRVTVEYMLGGLAVIASDSGANSEILENMKSGIIYQLHNTKDLASKIELLYNDRFLLRDISIEAQKRVCEKFTSNINTKNIYHLYEKVLK